MTTDLRSILELVESGRITPEEGQQRMRSLRDERAVHPASGTTSGKVAIIGMSAQFADAADTGELWKLLVDGKTGVREVPGHRWNARSFYDPDPRTPGRTNCVRGGFLEAIDQFDPLFFNISGREAEAMDPQQRLFLEASWTALEDAGYAGDSVSGVNCGVYAGAPASDYATESERCGVDSDAQVLMGNDTAILAARISYLLNLRGPSLSLNTACSSSLVAVHLAAQAISSGECEMALAGGVCLFVSPGFYLSASTADMLSPDGECFTFDHRANGFVPGEGVGVVVLKDLNAAIRDGDHIRGVLIGSAINQDGKTNGITAPSAQAQHAVQLAAYRAAGITPDTIGMVEAHGTGTALGDPIEIDALTRSFGEHVKTTGSCAIGSIKTNIGHTGQAAGVAGLIKVLLSFEHEIIPPTRNFERANARIDFASSPFRIVTEPEPWPAQGTPRRGAVSSFGYSGTNAHIVIEEPPQPAVRMLAAASHLFLLSAKTEDALRARLRDLADWLEGCEDAVELADIAFTLHVGRKHFPRRAAFVASSAAELRTALADGPRPAAKVGDIATFADQVHADLASVGRNSPEWTEVLSRAAEAFTAGESIDPRIVFGEARGGRVSLPTYRFARESYWSRPVDTPVANAAVRLVRRSDTEFVYQPGVLDPLVADHVVGGSPILAAMMSVELAATAVEAAGRGPVSVLSDLAWHRPVLPFSDGGVVVRLESSDDVVDFALDAASGSRPAVSGSARVNVGAQPESPLPLEELRRRLTTVVEGADCYRTFQALGIAYGPAYQVLQELRVGDGEVLARIEVPDAAGHHLHPLLLDGALQAMIGLADEAAADTRRLPRSLDSISRHGPLPATCLAHVRQIAANTIDVDVADPEGTVLVALRGLHVAEVPRTAPALLRPVWKQTETITPALTETSVLVLDDDGDLFAAVARNHSGGTVLLARPGDRFEQVGQQEFLVRPGDAGDLRALVDAAQGVCPGLVIVNWGAGLPEDHRRALHTLISIGQGVTGNREHGPLGVRFIHRTTTGRLAPSAAGLAGAARTLRREDPDLIVQVVGLEAEPERHLDLLLAVPSPEQPPEVLVDAAGSIRVRDFVEVSASAARPVLHSGGVYIITGGAGAIGRAIVGHFAERGASVVVLGRSEGEKALPGPIHYHQVDVSDRADLARVLDEVRRERGAIRGIVHAAGILRDGFLRDKAASDVDAVLEGKVWGALLLDELTTADPVDFMVLCSSAVAVVGNPGQVDYAYANAYLDAFALERSARGRRTISIGWPAWAGTGMAADMGTSDHAISTAEGLGLFDAAVSGVEPHLVALKADARQRRLLVDPTLAAVRQEHTAAEGAVDLRQRAEDLLVRVLAEELRVSAQRITASDPLEAYGIDSVMVMQLSRRLEEEFGPLPKTLFFEYLTLAELAGYFAERHAHRLAPPVQSQKPPAAVESGQSASDVRSSTTDGDIAIIGIAGRYPLADDLDQYWDNLVRGRDCVTEIPADRWSLEGFFSEQREPGKSYSKWGGFLSQVDRFDPVFFGIAPREADMIDPQERVFLETAWHALEDAGYPPSVLKGQLTGVFVGVMYGHYQLNGPAPDGRMPVSSFASIANRVSYLFDFQGPSLAVDTMCSSSLTAIHLACAALRRGECDTAVAGGVNLSLHPDKYRQLSLGGFAASDGRCHSFGDGGDGYVPGEGVGAVLLKPLERALADRDHIHAVIRGSALNHGGKTNGYTVPNPRAQATAITSAMREAGASIQDVGYVEAHGTGTALGDPIEVNALSRAYGPVSGRRIPIGSAKSAIGHLESAAGIAALTKVVLQLRHRTLPPTLHAETLNPNIDFAESPLAVHREAGPWRLEQGQDRLTAGISSFGAGGANAHLVVSEAPPRPSPKAAVGPWILVLSAKSEESLKELASRLAALLDGSSGSLRDAVSADVLGRVAALLGLRVDDLSVQDLLPECGFDEIVRAKLGVELALACELPLDDLPQDLDTVAAITDHLIEEHETELRAFFEISADSRGAVPSLADVAHTLQVGREAMPRRLAVVAATHVEAVAELAAYAAGTGGRHVGRVGTEELTVGAGEGLHALAAAWVCGADADWASLDAGGQRIPLVLYPFVRERHWLDSASRTGQAPTPLAPAAVERPQPRTASADLLTHVEDVLRGLASAAIGLEPDRFDPLVSFGDYGFESLTMKALSEQISERFGVEFSPTVFFERTGLRGAATWLLDEHGPDVIARGLDLPVTREENQVSTTSPHVAVAEPSGDAGDEPIAVIGMSGRFPGAADLQEYWANLRDQRDLVTEIPEDRWDWRELDREDLPADQRCPFRWGAFLDGVDEFDPLFFGISPAEAEMMDPQQRLLLQTAWAAIEDAGYRPSAFAGQAVGLFAGIQFNDYQHLLHEAGVLNAQAALGNEHSISVNRISYLLDLRGPSEPVNTACSSSLVAVHRAVRSLRRGESTVALAGGIALNLSSHSTIAAGMMGLLSPDGRCKTLSSTANGYVKGEGVGLLVLKPLSQAVADRDNVLAVITGTSVNHGGRAASLTAPNASAQAELIRSAVTEAGVEPDSIGYIELHGTGTELGDPVEISGITSAFRKLHAENNLPAPTTAYCGIGSVKTNIGHLEPASGIAGLVKIIQSIRHRTLAGMAHLGEVNPYVKLDRTPFYIVDQTKPWEPATAADGTVLPLRAGVSSFGFGGVNAHVLVEEHRPDNESTSPGTNSEHVFVLSARTEDALAEQITGLLARVEAWTTAGTAPSPSAVAATLQSGREEFTHRLAVVATSIDDLGDKLRGLLSTGTTVAGIHRGEAETGVEVAGTLPDDLAWAWVRGAKVVWPATTTSKVALPTYPFARKRFWFTAPDRPRVSAALTSGSVSGEEAVRVALRAILMDKLKLSETELEDDRDLKDFGVDSILSAMIMQLVQEQFGVQVSLTALIDHPTVTELAKHIFHDVLDGVATGIPGVVSTTPRAETGLRYPPELLPINTEGTGQASFWVHGAAGYSAWFDNLSRALGPDYPLYAFQAKGTDGHSMPQLMDEMADHYVECIRTVQPEGPYVIGGYSFGGLVAMEVARRLRAAGETIRHLIMFDTYPATQEVFDRHNGIYDEDFLRFYLINYFLKIDEHPERAIRPAELKHLPSSLREQALCKLAKDRGQKRISADDIYLYLRGGLNCSAHSEGMYQTYEMRPYDASDVLFFKATDGFTGRASAAYWPETRILDGYDYLTPWRNIIEGEFRSVELDNDHLNMLEEPTLDIAARHIGAILREPPALNEKQYSQFRSGFDAVTTFGHELLAGNLGGRVRRDGVMRTELADSIGVGEGTGVRRLFSASVDILVREGFLVEDTTGLRPTELVDALDVSAESVTAKASELAERYPEAADYLPLLVAAQAELPAVLAGEKQGTDVLMPGGSMHLVADLYKGNVQTEYYNLLVADCVAERVRRHVRRFPHSTVQIFEVGAGTGGTSEFLFRDLDPHAERLKYFFTDIGGVFVEGAKQRFATSVPYVRFLTHDIERAAEAQGIEPHSMDLVVASNVLHATRRLADTVAHCARLLKPNGALVINELTHRLDYNTLTFGLTDGWWLFEDEEVRIPGSPLLTARTWRAALSEVGLTEVEVHGVPGACEDDQAQCVIVATRGERIASASTDEGDR